MKVVKFAAIQMGVFGCARPNGAGFQMAWLAIQHEAKIQPGIEGEIVKDNLSPLIFMTVP